jgi:hypothetical protein
LLLSSELTIKFRTSRDYVRLAVILYLMAIVVAFSSALSVKLLFLITPLLSFFLIRICWIRTPESNYSALIYGANKNWFLQSRSGKKTKYDLGGVCFDGGLFILFRLKTNVSSKTIVIFRDQLTSAEYRLIKLLR